MKNHRLMCGWGINDVDYKVHKHSIVGGKNKIVWVCPYYKKWSDMVRRCFNCKHQERYPTYKNCSIHEEWKYLSNFIKWVDSQPNRDWQNCSPDKDLLVCGNKHYGPDTVVFVSNKINLFITDHGKGRGACMIGVTDRSRKSKKNPYDAQCCNPFTRKGGYVGCFSTELEAHKAWQAKKHEYACILADMQEDPRVAKVLRERYAPDKDWTKV